MPNRSSALARRDQLQVVGHLRRAMQHSARLTLSIRQREAQRADVEAAAALHARSEAEQLWAAALGSRSPDPRLVQDLASIVVARSVSCDEAAEASRLAADRAEQARRAWSGALAAERAGEIAITQASSLVRRIDDERAAIIREELSLRAFKARS